MTDKETLDRMKFLAKGGTNFSEKSNEAREIALSALQERIEREKKPLTNADRIRAMSDEDLARFLAEVENRRSAWGGGATWNGMAHALNWLQQPAEGEHHG